MRTRSGLLVVFMIAVLGFDSASQRAIAGLPGYFEWVLWKDVNAENPTERGRAGAKLEWVVGPYPKLSECEHERDRLAETLIEQARPHSRGRPIAADGVVTVTSAGITIRFFCVPDTVNPRVDRRWP